MLVAGHEPQPPQIVLSIWKLERAKGFEPSTPTLARLCSTPELHPLKIRRSGVVRWTAGRRSSATAAISLNRFWNAIVYFAVSVEILPAAGLFQRAQPMRLRMEAGAGESVVSASLYSRGKGCKNDR